MDLGITGFLVGVVVGVVIGGLIGVVIGVILQHKWQQLAPKQTAVAPSSVSGKNP